MNTQLAEPILTAITTAWERVFIHEVAKNLQTLSIQISEVMDQFHETVIGMLMRAGSQLTL